MQTFAQSDVQKHDTHKNVNGLNLAEVKLIAINRSAAVAARSRKDTIFCTKPDMIAVSCMVYRSVYTLKYII